MVTVTAAITSCRHHLVTRRQSQRYHVLQAIVQPSQAMSLPIIQESAEDGDSPETDSELLMSPSTIHHKTRRETAFSLDGALLFRLVLCFYVPLMVI